MPMKTFRAQVPVVLELEVLGRGLEPAAIVEAIKERFAGVADPFSGCQVFFAGTYTSGHVMARTRNATLISDSEITVTLDDESPHSSPRQEPSS
jgi:hypothetical protein